MIGDAMLQNESIPVIPRSIIYFYKIIYNLKCSVY